jgi:hypothetical protein
MKYLSHTSGLWDLVVWFRGFDIYQKEGQIHARLSIRGPQDYKVEQLI